MAGAAFFLYICHRMKLKDLCEDDRPREKMLSKGAAALSNAELLAILLRTGTGRMNAVDVAREMLIRAEGRLEVLASGSIENLCGVSGVGTGKAVTVAAAFELGRRLAEESALSVTSCIDSPAKVCRIMLPYLKGLDHEEFWVMFLNRANRLIAKERLSSGGQDSTVIDKRVVLRRAVERKASGIILVHNHPSGLPAPSVEDVRQTKDIRKALASCDLQVLDHVIIAGNGYYSFADECLVENA